ncbi:MAG: hypothetical protein CMC07_02205 [Flavobacteriaceae bacterium]|jgi:hypothetical protein|nr:hypothetical protein [Flavobacteriaceae bacterium]HBY67687.1 hypothetical protein [Flavobacteriaceae bacterium]|tara:strand:- start:91 stop:270 length:180 start_codon:yes stop_codon:yes gene_type:complete
MFGEFVKLVAALNFYSKYNLRASLFILDSTLVFFENIITPLTQAYAYKHSNGKGMPYIY